MGSKRNIANDLVNYILEHNPNTEYVYDLFGGGGSISFEFLQRSRVKKVIYNELNTGVCELLKDVLENGVTEKYYEWVSRETFHQYKNNNDWYGGLIKTIWSFGNSQASYIFGKEIEDYKKNYHLVVVNNINKLKEMEDFCIDFVLKKYGIKQDLKLTMPIKKEYQERRLEIRQQLNAFEKKCKINQKNIANAMNTLQRLQQLERLEQLQQLQLFERLEQLQQFERLQILNKNYLDVVIDTPIKNTIIYLDPPYQNTKVYQENIEYDILNDYIKKSPYKIYCSGYDMNLNCVFEIAKRCKLSATANNKVIEKLYCNQSENILKKKKLF